MRINPLTATSPMLCPSILSADFSRLAAECDQVLSAGADFLHLDIMDGHFVPNISFGPPIVKSLRPTNDSFFDAHLMISDPLRYAPAFAKAGCNALTFHIEVAPNPAHVANEFRKLGVHPGITLNPATPPEAIFPALDHVDHVLVMSVVPGFSGQKFMPEVLPKCEAIKKRLRPDQRLQIDGGINPDTITSAKNAGVDWFVVASAIFDHPDRPTAIAQLKQLLSR